MIAWNTENIYELRALLVEAKELGVDVDKTSLPTMEIPDDISTSDPVWAMDKSGRLLVGANADEIITLVEYRGNKPAQ